MLNSKDACIYFCQKSHGRVGVSVHLNEKEWVCWNLFWGLLNLLCNICQAFPPNGIIGKISTLFHAV